MATAFGPEGMCILEMLSRISPSTCVFIFDTGYQFPETLKLRDQVAQKIRHRSGVVVSPELRF